MRHAAWSFASSIAVLLALVAPATADPINAVVGDASWTSAMPADAAPEQLRIRTHLRYVRERLGRVAGSPARQAALAALDGYIARGEFPRRTGDPYAGRRPRFIDDRGVHCAVGFLIAASGQPELARAINAEHEYAYVHDIASPALAAWASSHGFAIDELAMIQPSYSSPPTEYGTRRELADTSAGITIACAKKHPPTASVKLRVVGDERGRVTATPESSDAFDRCYADTVTPRLQDNGAWNSSPKKFAYTIAIAVPRPAALYEKRVAGLHYDESCTPRPGAVPATATLEFTGTNVVVTTSPSNPEVDRCLAKNAQWGVKDFDGIANLRASRRLAIPSRLDPARVREWVVGHASVQATECYPAKGLPATINVTLTAKRDDADFAIRDDSGQPEFSTCLRERLLAELRHLNSTSREIDGKYEPYRRIDRDVDVTAQVKVESPAARAKRQADQLKRIRAPRD